MPRVRVNGIDLHYEQKGDGVPLLLIHGLGTGSADWEMQLPALAREYRVIAPCLRGFGDSERSCGPYTISVFAADVLALMDALGIEDGHLCGVSMGGAVAFQLAVDVPQRVRSLITINSQPSFELDTLKKRLLVHSRSLAARLLGVEPVSKFLSQRNFPGHANRALRQRLAGRFKNDLQPYLEALAALAGWTVVDQLDLIRAPVLFIAAELDYTSPREKSRYAAAIANARVEIIAGAHHAAHLERPDEVNAAILGFLREIDPAKSRIA